MGDGDRVLGAQPGIAQKGARGPGEAEGGAHGSTTKALEDTSP